LLRSIKKIREQLFAKGTTGLAKVARVFRQADFNGNKKLDLDEFEEAMSFAGLFLKKDEISALFKSYDKDGDGNINYDEFLQGMASPLEGRRLIITKKAFDKLDRDGSNVIEFAEVSSVYDASQHPDVKQGRKTARGVTEEFLSGFEGGRGAKDGRVSLDEFLAYYKDLSASIPSDEYYVQMMQSCWKIKENPSAEVDGRLQQMFSVLRQKLDQKTKTGKNPADTLKAVFKHFDSDESGQITPDEFNSAVGRFGLSLDARDKSALFAIFDKDGSGTINSNEFIRVLYKDE
jgi:Ca2+-binding EF-hand superfamily protein